MSSPAPAPTWLRPIAGGTAIDVLVQPRASRTRIVGEHGGRLKLQLAAPPVDGEANAALIELLAGALGVQKRDLSVASGATGKRKTIHVAGLDGATVASRLASKGG